MDLPALGLLSRRHMMRAMMATAVAAGVSGCADLIPQGLGLALTPSPLTDPAVFNFALNLEYLEAEFYQRGVYGRSLPTDLLGPDPKPVIGGRQVSFQTPVIREFMAEIAEDELNHVRFIRQTIKASPLIELSRPTIDLQSSFREAGRAAGLGDNFDPFADEVSFLLAAFLFEDVGVSAYTGAAKLIAGSDSLAAAAGILAVEAYHGGLIRAQIADMGPQVIASADAIARARDQLDGPVRREQPISAGDVYPGEIVISPTDPQGRSFPRPAQKVLNIAFLNPSDDADHGGFFPEGVQGVVRHALLGPTPAQTRRV